MIKFILGFVLGYWMAFNKDAVIKYCNKFIQWITKIVNKKKSNNNNENDKSDN